VEKGLSPEPEASSGEEESQSSSGEGNLWDIPGAKAEAQLARLCKEGGVPAINFLLSKAVSPIANDTPTKSPKEWTYRDIVRLPEAERETWRTACNNELDALRRRKVFDLVDRPHGRRVIKNRWVFDVKSDGRKRA
jgi:hypothetical protein